MRITVVCTDLGHPVYPYLERWCASRRGAYEITLTDKVDNLPGGDFLFLISCARIIEAAVRLTYRHALVIHASDLPEGRGWSPIVWQLLEGRSDIAVTLLTAEDPVDSGDVWGKRWLHLEGHELADEINSALFNMELELMDYAIQVSEEIKPQPQNSNLATWYPRRKPEDSRVDPMKPIASQFELLRVADFNRYPAFFDFRGYRYEITIRKKV